MVPSGLPYLPPEIHSLVLSWILRRSDLKNVMLTTKAMRELAMPLLYRYLTINVDHCKHDALAPLLAPGHSGHPLIRTLNVVSDDEVHDAVSLKITKTLLRVLPQDGLERFGGLLNANIDNEIMSLLATTQRKLSSLHLGSLAAAALAHTEYLPGWPLSLLSWPPKVTSLSLPWRVSSTEELEFYSALIERSGGKLKNLTICSNALGPEDDSCSLFAQVGLAEEPMKTLFHQRAGTGTPSKMTIDSLILQHQRLDFTASYLCSAISLANVQELCIWESDQTDALLTRLIEAFRKERSQLQILDISITYSASPPRLVPELLRTFTGLEYLIVSHWCTTAEDTKFDLKCLETHKSTLTDLYLGTGQNGTNDCPLYVFPEKDLSWLCKRMRNLRQVAIAMPDIRLEDALAHEWGDFGAAMACLGNLEHLAVLRILTWPTVDQSSCTAFPETDSARLHFCRGRYLRQLNDVASSIARLNSIQRHGSKARLSVLIFGSMEDEDCVKHVGGSTMRMHFPAAYKIRTVWRARGRVDYKADWVDAAMMKYEEPLGCVVGAETDQGLA